MLDDWIKSSSEGVKNWPGRPNRLPHFPCCARVCKVGGAGGFACRANFSHLLTLGAMWPPRNTANRYRLRLAAMRGRLASLRPVRNRPLATSGSDAASAPHTPEIRNPTSEIPYRRRYVEIGNSESLVYTEPAE